VYDLSFFAGKLRNRVLAIQEETEALRKRQQDGLQAAARAEKLRERLSVLETEVREAQGKLFDVNALQQRLRARATPADLVAEAKGAAEAFARARSEADAVFLQRVGAEEEAEAAEAAAEELQEATNQLIIQLVGADGLDRYQQTRASLGPLRAQEAELAAELTAATAAAAAAELEARYDPARLRALEAQRALAAARDRQAEALAELAAARAEAEEDARVAASAAPVESVDQAVARLRADVKARTAQLTEAKQDLKLLATQLKQKQQLVAGLGEGDDGPVSEKEEAIVAKVRQMRRFLSSFPGARASKASSLLSLQATITQLSARVPANKVVDVGALSDEPLTGAALATALSVLTAELDRLSNLGGSLDQELQAAAGELQSVVARENDLKTQAAETAASVASGTSSPDELKALRVRLSARRSELSQDLSRAGADLRHAQTRAEANEELQDLIEYERRLARLATASHEAKEFIFARQAACDYSRAKQSVMNLLDRVSAISAM
jgi:chromosome segregation ATPase